MRQMFRDFEQLDRQAFAVIYQLNVPQADDRFGDNFAFLDLPLDLQREVLRQLHPSDLISAALVSKNWRAWSSRMRSNLVPKSGNWTILDNQSTDGVCLILEFYPTFFHFCFAHQRAYTPCKSIYETRRQYNSSFSRFEQFVLKNATAKQKEEIDLGKLKRLIYSEELHVYWHPYDTYLQFLFIELTESVGLGIIFSNPMVMRG